VIDVRDTEAQLHGDLLQNRVSIPGLPGPDRGHGVRPAALLGCRPKDMSPQLLGRVLRVHGELATIFEELGQTLGHQLARVVADGLLQLLFQLPARATRLSPEELKELFCQGLPSTIGGIDVQWQNPILDQSDPYQFAREHAVFPWLSLSKRPPH
jgi:hypothetical protein